MKRGMHRLIPILLCGLTLVSTPLLAQRKPAPAPDEPAVQTSTDQPAISTSPAAAPVPATGPRPSGDGTTIIGERESPIGLYITPWRNAAAESDIDRPAKLLSVQLEPLDKRVLSRQLEYYEALTAARLAKERPAAPASSPAP